MHNLSIVVPCYNEQEVLPETCRRLVELLGRLESAARITGASRIYFVDDGSRDQTWNLIEAYVERGLPVAGVKLSRNRGHQNALLAGLFAADGEAIVSVDADLQDDLGAIEEMLRFFEEGCDIVYGVRRGRDTDSLFKRSTAQGFYRLMGWFGTDTVYNHADYRLLSRRAIEALKEYREVNLFLRGIVPLIGFKSAIVEYDRVARFAGESKYPLRKMLGLALNAITSFSIAPLRFISVLGFLVSTISAALGLWVLVIALFTDRAVAGWASTVLPIYFLDGLQLLALGVIGEYIGKIYLETKARPRFLVENTLRREFKRR